jgi:uncharacterized protein YeaO (DUF488 family)
LNHWRPAGVIQGLWLASIILEIEPGEHKRRWFMHDLKQHLGFTRLYSVTLESKKNKSLKRDFEILNQLENG